MSSVVLVLYWHSNILTHLYIDTRTSTDEETATSKDEEYQTTTDDESPTTTDDYPPRTTTEKQIATTVENTVFPIPEPGNITIYTFILFLTINQIK